MKIGYISKFSPEKDGGAIYADNLCKNMPCKVVRIGDVHSDADYRINFRSLSLGRKLAAIVEKEKLDLLHVQYVVSGTYFGKYKLNMPLVWALKQKVPFIVTFTEVHPTRKGLRETALWLIQRLLAKRCSATVAHTPQQTRYMATLNKNSYNIYMGLIPRKQQPGKGKNLLFFGILGPGKGVEYLVKAMDRLPDWNLTIAGSAASKKYAQLLQGLVKKSNSRNITLDIRWVPEDAKARYFQQADIVIYPYVWAPYQSGALHDALSYGKPVVVTRTGGIWEVIEKYHAGVVIPPRNAAAIPAAVKDAAKHYATYQKGNREYAKLANWKEVGRRHVALYKEILSGKKLASHYR